MIRVVVAEDSRAAADLLVAILESDPAIRVVGRAHDGAQAVEMAERLRPDLVTMDLHMPVMDGFAATREIMVRSPVPIIVVSAAAVPGDVEMSLRATQLGAVMVMPKPSAPGSEGFEEERRELVAMARAMAEVKVVRRWASSSSAASPSAPTPRARPAGAPVRVVAVAASTGGPAALRQILSALPGSFPAPVLVVQHIARGFVEPLVQWLGGGGGVRVKLAEAGERPEPGVAYLAPDDAHLVLGADGRIALDDSAPVGGFRPSATALFRSVGRCWGSGAAAVILTGMGDDGVEGLRAARAAGVRVIAQDEATSIVYGMPREAIAAGLADEVLPLDGIAARLEALAKG